jgi:3-oxoacyl-[acyl-carrier-protein] synthase-3
MRAQQFAPETEETERAMTRRPEIAFEQDFLRWMLSDGAGAWALQSKLPSSTAGTPRLRVDWIETFSHANAVPACMVAGATVDPGGELRGWMQHEPARWLADSVFAVKQDVRLLDQHIDRFMLVEPLVKLRARRDLSWQSIDWFVPHLSSHFFADRLVTALAEAGFPIPRDRWFTNLEVRGNTGSASAYILIHDLIHDGRLRSGQRVLLYVPESARFGSGFVLLTAM